MNYSDQVSNFCEKQLFPNQPEYINAFSAFFLCYISMKNLRIPKHKKIGPIKDVIYWCIFANGISSFTYHWYGWYIFKLADEFTMIIPIWLGAVEIIYHLNYPHIYIGAITLYNASLLVFDTFMWFEFYFSLFFAMELLLLIPLYIKSLHKQRDPKRLGLKGIIISSASGICWWITERNCHIYLIWGHAVWHIGIGVGLSYLINYFSSEMMIRKS